MKKLERPFEIVVCASGGGGNFQALIDAQSSSGYQISRLIVDRECGAIQRAAQNNIACVRVKKGVAFENDLLAAIPESTRLVVLAGFMPIIPPKVCASWRGRMINTHPSLLPKFGGKGMYGVRVQEAVLLAKEAEAGCTVHFVDENIDTGQIILQTSIAVRPGESAWDLGGRVFNEETKLLVEAVQLVLSDQAKEF